MRHLAVAFAALFILAFAALDRFDAPPMLPLVSEAEAAAPKAAPVQRASLPSPYMIDTATLAFVDCDHYMGTAVHLGGGRYITAAHVATSSGCRIGGKPVSIESIDTKADWAIVTSAARLPFYVITSCDRLVEGETYFASGYAEGNPWPVTTRLVAEHYRDADGISMLKGAIVAGMSGGAVVDRDGVLHAINESRMGDGIPLAGVVELADTALCKAGK